VNVVFDADYASVTAEPAHGRAVTFEVRFRKVSVSRSPRYVVGLKGSDGDGFAHFTTFDRACRSAMWRARRYERAFDKPRRHAASRTAALEGAA
jgi:hypothetical protein